MKTTFRIYDTRVDLVDCALSLITLFFLGIMFGSGMQISKYLIKSPPQEHTLEYVEDGIDEPRIESGFYKEPVIYDEDLK